MAKDRKTDMGCILTVILIFMSVSKVFPDVAPTEENKLTFEYINNKELVDLLRREVSNHRDIARLHTIGTSEEGRDIVAVQLTRNIEKGKGIEPGKPMFKYVGNVHGNEVIGRQILINLIEYLLGHYGKDDRVTKLVNETNIHIMPTMNPDGFHRAHEGSCSGLQGSGNAEYVDLNYDFPNKFWGNETDIQSETRAIMNWILRNKFVLSANFQGGDVFATYPYGDQIESDEPIFKHLAQTYANNHKEMHTGTKCTGQEFPDGIANDAVWHDISGQMRDYNYFYGSCFEITLKLSCCKYPLAKGLKAEWDNNKMALLAYMEEVHKGVKGFVSDSETAEPIPNAVINVSGFDHNVTTASNGDFWRLLVPGTYIVTAMAERYDASSSSVKVVEGPATTVNFKLHKHGAN